MKGLRTDTVHQGGPTYDADVHNGLRAAYDGRLVGFKAGYLSRRSGSRLAAMNFARVALGYYNQYDGEELLLHLLELPTMERVKLICNDWHGPIADDLLGPEIAEIPPFSQAIVQRLDRRIQPRVILSSDWTTLGRWLHEMECQPSASAALFDNGFNMVVCLKVYVSTEAQIMYMVFDPQASSSGAIRQILSTSRTRIAQYMSKAISDSTFQHVHSSIRAHFTEFQRMDEPMSMAFLLQDQALASELSFGSRTPPVIPAQLPAPSNVIFENELKLAIQISLANLEDPEAFRFSTNSHVGTNPSEISDALNPTQDSAEVNCIARGPKKHLKRLAAPSSWMLDKLSGTYAPRPSPGPHKLRESLPLTIFLRNRLKYALNGREVTSIVKQRLIKIDNKVRTDETFPAGFMDVISIEKSGEHFRLLYDVKGRFTIHRITPEEATYKLLKVRRVAIGARGVPHVVTHDGRTIRYPDPLIQVNDTVKFDLEQGKIVDFVKFDTGNIVMITGGRNMGRAGIIVHREKHVGGFDIVHVKDSLDRTFATRVTNIFVIGEGIKPWISLPKGKGTKLTISEERDVRRKQKAADQ
ncbi:hypothetical protein C0991_000354 [Blastosporella zonata]|nr:hypothetical protein C0991_000354 [Blastosporella zonata]